MSRMLASLSMSIWDQSLIASLIEQKITPAWTIAVENGNNVPNTSSHFNIHKRKAALILHLRSSETRISCFLWSLWLDYIDDWIIHYTYNYVYIYVYARNSIPGLLQFLLEGCADALTVKDGIHRHVGQALQGMREKSQSHQSGCKRLAKTQAQFLFLPPTESPQTTEHPQAFCSVSGMPSFSKVSRSSGSTCTPQELSIHAPTHLARSTATYFELVPHQYTWNMCTAKRELESATRFQKALSNLEFQKQASSRLCFFCLDFGLE